MPDTNTALVAENLNIPVITGNNGYVIFFDNIRIDQFVTDYSVTMGTDSTIGSATINMIYVPELDKVIHQQVADYDRRIVDGTNTFAGSDDGVENMTNLRIFVKNIFNNKYTEIFGGNITSKSTTTSGGERKLSFQAQDFMNWLTRTICPIAVPFDGTLSKGDRLKWKAQGIDLDKVQSVNSVADITFKGKTLSQTWQTISQQTISANSLYSAEDTVAKWDDAISRVVIMGDISEDLRKAEVMDFMITSSTTQVNSVYVLMNDILKTLMFEFYQDRDETIRIKPPFWNENVLKNHVIDPALIMSYTESSNFNQMYTRIIATGGLDEWHKTGNTSTDIVSLITPVVAVTSAGLEDTSGQIAITSDVSTAVGGGAGSNIATSAVAVAKQYLGVPYVWGGSKPSGFDCSGLIDYAYKQAGYTGFGARETTYTLINKGREVTSLSDVMPGDIILPHEEHVYMAISKTEIIEAPKPGLSVRIRAMPPNFWHIRRLVEWDGTNNTSQSKTYTKPEEIGEDILLNPTSLEKKYGPLIYECSQPLIKFSNASSVLSSADYWQSTNHGSAYYALTKYARFMLNYLNSSVTVASMQTIAMPWLRPGFNVWVDPVRTDKIFYITGLNHYGNSSGNFTTLNLSMGRHKEDFISNKNSIGGLSPGQSDDIFVNKLLVTPDNFGEICNYNEIATKVKAFYNTQKTDTQEFFTTDSYFQYFYSSGSKENKYSSEVSNTPSTVTPAAIEELFPSLSRLLKSSSPMMQGDDIKSAQTMLKKLGYNPGTADGWYGNNTKNATIAFQRDKGLSADGQIGPLTWLKLNQLNNSSASGSGGGYGAGTVNVSSAGLRVRSGPSLNNGQIGTLWNGNQVQIISEQDGWYNILFNGNSSAWASANYISKTSEPVSEVPATPDTSSKYASSSGVADLGNDMTIEEIQTKLNTKYATANSTVKFRVTKLTKNINAANIVLKQLTEGLYVDSPYSVTTGANQ